MKEKEFTVVVTHAIPKAGLEALFERCRVIYPEHAPAFSEEELARILPECDAVLAGGAMTGEMIRRAGRLRIISNYGAGYEQIDVDAAEEAGVLVTNIPDSTAESTAELAFTLMLCMYRRAAELDRMLRERPSREAFGMGRHMGHNLSGATLGMGRIGGRLAEMAAAFGMKVIYHNRRPVPGKEDGWRTLEALIAEADVVSLHCPLTDRTRGMIGRRQIGRMKPGAALINTARGGVLDYDALVDALIDGRLSGAGLDVYPDEPEVPEALKRLENVVLTPHVGTNTFETRRKMAEAASLRILAVMDGKIPPNVIRRGLRDR